MASGLYFFPLAFLGSSVAEVYKVKQLLKCKTRIPGMLLLLPGNYDIACVLLFACKFNRQFANRGSLQTMHREELEADKQLNV